jgi:hypothetical protein
MYFKIVFYILYDIVPLGLSQYGANYPTKHNIQI